MAIEVRDLRNGDWYWIHKSVIKNHSKYLGVYGLAVYHLLAYFAGKEGKAFPSLSTMEKMLGASRPTILKAIAKLEKRNLIRVVRGGGGREVNQFYLLKTEVKDVKGEVNVVNERGKGRLLDKELRTRITNNKGLKKLRERMQEFNLVN